jgi:hypothetical protein
LFPSHDRGGGASSDVGLNVEKLRAAKEILDANEVDPMDPRFCVVNAKQLRNLLAETEIGSADYNSVKSLVQGEVDTFLGFKFIRTELIGVDGNLDHKVLFFAKSGMLLAMAAEPTAKIDVRPDKSYATQAYISVDAGATRMEESKVGRIICDPS